MVDSSPDLATATVTTTTAGAGSHAYHFTTPDRDPKTRTLAHFSQTPRSRCLAHRAARHLDNGTATFLLL